MREIKFRAWDGKNMYPHDEVVLYLSKAWVENIAMDAKVIHVKDTPPLLPMQFTGLKDKNGKEIYEGDIVRRNYVPDEGVVAWVHTGWMLDLVKGNIGRGGLDLSKRCEVIGNIYENPELIP